MKDLLTIKKGAFWVFLVSIVGGPLAIFRNWLFQNFDPTESWIGSFAIIMIIFNFSCTFFVYGGNSVLTNFIPKINDKSKEINFLNTLVLISISLFITLTVTFSFFPDILTSISNGKLNQNHIELMSMLGLPIILSQSIIFFIQGRMDYKKSSLLSQVNNILILISICIVILLIELGFLNIDFVSIWFFATLILASSLIVILFFVITNRKDVIQKIKFYTPNNFWSFSIHVHLLTILTFVYQNYDQIFLLKILDVKSLGIYFIMIQLVETIRFIPVKLGQVLLASFSKLVSENDNENLHKNYKIISRLVIIMNLILSLFVVCFSEFILELFKIESLDYLTAFIMLVIGYNFAAIGNINSMLLLAKEKSKAFFIVNLIIVFLMVSLLLLFKKLGFEGVVLSKSLTILSGQVLLFVTLKLSVTGFKLPLGNYLFSQILLITVCLIIGLFNIHSILITSLIFLTSLGATVFYYKIGITDFKRFLKK